MIEIISRFAARFTRHVTIDRRETLTLSRRTYDTGYYDTVPAGVDVTYEGGTEIGVEATPASRDDVLEAVIKWLFEEDHDRV